MTLELRKQKMLEYKGKLEEFCKSLDGVLGEMDTKLKNLCYSGLPEDIHQNYVGYYYVEDAKAINELVENIYSAHFGYIDTVISDFDAALNRK
jgi:hypothetical protein